MSVRRRFEGHGFPSFVTTNVAGRRPIFADQRAAARLKEIMAAACAEESASLLAWVIMPDHLHMVVSLPTTGSLGRLMQLIKGRFARFHNLKAGIAGSVWQDRFHEKAIRDQDQFDATITYILNNPVEARLSRRPEEYPWCSATGVRPWLGQAEA